MAGLHRRVISTDVYEGSRIESRYMGPDLLAYVEGVELAGFYIDAGAARRACARYVDAKLKDDREAREKADARAGQKAGKKGRR